MEVFEGISAGKLEEIIQKIKNLRVLLIGDLCLDVYWMADMTRSELSRETPHFPLPVVSERMSPGAGGNTAANIAALRPLLVKVIGAIGRDWRGTALLGKLRELGIDTESVAISEKIVTNAYCKPYRKGISAVEYEDPRIDFSNYESLDKQVEQEVINLLNESVDSVDVVCVSDQFTFGCITPAMRERLISIGKTGKPVVVDSRNRIGEYHYVILKPNEVEGYRAAYVRPAPEDTVFEEYIQAAGILAENNRSKVCMTLGANGCVFADSQSVIHIPARYVAPPIDFCGAGDTFLSAFSCALATGVMPWEAASFANMAAEVTIKKLGTTGTASPEEIRAGYA